MTNPAYPNLDRDLMINVKSLVASVEQGLSTINDLHKIEDMLQEYHEAKAASTHSSLRRPAGHLYDWTTNYTSDVYMFPLVNFSGSTAPRVILNDKDVSYKEISRCYTGHTGWIDVLERNKNGAVVAVEGPGGRLETSYVRLTGRVELYTPIPIQNQKVVTDGEESPK
jgi:hypothetical protein